MSFSLMLMPTLKSLAFFPPTVPGLPFQHWQVRNGILESGQGRQAAAIAKNYEPRNAARQAL
jgi:hypothetical protein